MVTIFLPARLAAGMTHERTGWPSTSTVQAPHCAIPHPYFVPARLRTSRSTQRSGISGSTSTSWTRPFTLSLVMGISGGETRAGGSFCYRTKRFATSPHRGRESGGVESVPLDPATFIGWCRGGSSRPVDEASESPRQIATHYHGSSSTGAREPYGFPGLAEHFPLRH